LIGRIGAGDWFLIGSRKSLAADTSGELVLAINDTIHSDNIGSYSVSLNPAFFYDDFDDTDLDNAWFWLRESPANWNLEDRSSHLRIYTQYGTLHGGNPLPENVLLRNAPTADFEVSTRFEINPTEDYQEAALLLYEDDDNYVKISRLHHTASGGHILLFLVEQDSIPITSTLLFAQTVVELQLEYQGNNVTGSYRDQNGIWTELGQRLLPESSSFSFLGVAAHNGCKSHDVPSVPADFDFIQANPVVPLQLQTTLPWGEQPYAYYPDDKINNIGKWGCYTTSGAMLVNYWGRNVDPPFSTNPGLLDSWLKTKDGYDSDNGVIPGQIQAYAQLPTNRVPLYYHDVVWGNNDDLLDDYIFSGYPVIIRVNDHFVVVTGKTKVEDNDTYKINDPLYSKTTLYEQHNVDYSSIRLFANYPADQRTLRISAHSPIELLVTDPLGNRSGFDPTTGTYWYEIPDAEYVVESIAARADPSQGEYIESKYLEISHPFDGNYVIQILGTDTGSYEVDVFAANSQGQISVVAFTGSAYDGSSDVQDIVYDSYIGLPTSFVFLPCIRR
jgi:hypothetical protein